MVPVISVLISLRISSKIFKINFLGEIGEIVLQCHICGTLIHIFASLLHFFIQECNVWKTCVMIKSFTFT